MTWNEHNQQRYCKTNAFQKTMEIAYINNPNKLYYRGSAIISVFCSLTHVSDDKKTQEAVISS